MATRCTGVPTNGLHMTLCGAGDAQGTFRAATRWGIGEALIDKGLTRRRGIDERADVGNVSDLISAGFKSFAAGLDKTSQSRVFAAADSTEGWTLMYLRTYMFNSSKSATDMCDNCWRH